MTLFVSGHPCPPTSPTRTLKSEQNDTIDYLDPLFPDIISSHPVDDFSIQSYLEHDMPSPSSASSVHDTPSALTTPSPASQYDVLQTDKHISPADLLTAENPNMIHSTLSMPDSYHHLTSEYYARNNNTFHTNDHHSTPPPINATMNHLNNSATSLLDNTLQIRVLGIPSLGAKSRVETQIKLVIQLLSSAGGKAPNWSYVRLPEHLLARSKLRKTQQQQQHQQKQMDGSVATMVSDESKVLSLDAKVICSTDEEKSVRMCHGCVRRERKRAERTKDGKPRYESDALGYDIQQQSDYTMESDRDRILLFNCSSMVNFSSGDAILPTRITCYCRHHNEKIGFRIQFVMRNHHGYVIARGCSPPIMITDDHKSSKHRNNSISQPNTPSDTNSINVTRKRGRTDYESPPMLETPALSPRGSLSDNNNAPITTTMAPLVLDPTASFGIPSSASSPYPHERTSPSTDSSETSNRLLSPSSQTITIGNSDPTAMTPLADAETQPYLDTLQKSNAPPSTITDLLNSNPTHRIDCQNNNNPTLPISNYGANHNHGDGGDTNEYGDEAWPNQRRRRVMLNNGGGGYTSDDSPSLWRRTEQHPQPQLERLVPIQGPTYGGVEVTILGSGFYRGLTCLFGEHAASTVYWNPNTLVCVLPPAAVAGPVVVSFKEHPIVLEGQDVTLFTYFDASDQALLELALQVVGLKMTGKLHDAKHIAMLIVRGDQQNTQQQQQQQHGTNYSGQQQQTLTDIPYETDDNEDDDADDDNRSMLSNGSSDDDDKDSLDAWSWREGEDLESRIINALEASDAHDVMHTNTSGHTMLHLAVLLRYGALAKVLLKKMSGQPIDPSDRNGCTPLHFACLQNNAPMVQLLLDAGAQPTEKCSVGSTLELATDGSVRSLLLQSLSTTLLSSSIPSNNSIQASAIPAPTPIQLQPPLQRRHSLKTHLRKFYTLKQCSDDATSGQVVDNLEHNGLGFAQYKHDRRLYLFWLPLLIGNNVLDHFP
ncbi:hypothetical protein BCR42DRAFT_411759 [Absidia repens]|uniref:IPT/TIG domain-containing protein n=1 Tax=Absidia repens TaxID=90262 RepID=A0A1X2IM64_9FUNG|nr:hypothetical protein BCR42DRAFT_411759 [Absidia repens]